MKSSTLHLSVLLVCAVVTAVGQWQWQEHVVEDAAIYWTIADYLAKGAGYVVTLGGERVEAGSSPLWVALLALGGLVGLTPLTVSKALGAGLAVWGVTLTYQLARELEPEGNLVLVAPVLWAANAQVALWSASGLEGPLLAALVLWSAKRLLTRADAWAGVGFFLVTLARPEGVLYAAAAWAWLGLKAMRERRFRPWLVFTLALGVPWLVWQLVHLWLFAWPFSMPYYAKVEGREAGSVWAWGHRSWTYLRKASDELAYVWWLPLSSLALLRPRWALAAAAPLALLLVPDVRWGFTPLWFEEVRGPLLFVWVLAIGLVGAWREPRAALVWGMATAALLFAKLAGEDWMKGYRWVHPAVGPGAVLVAVGLVRLERALRPRLTQLVMLEPALGLSVLALLVPSQWEHHTKFGTHANTSPWKVKLRVDYKQTIIERLDLDPVVDLDVDMGANLWWGRFARELDLAGLVDIPVALHDQADAFWAEHLAEHRPDLAHVHDSWANKSGLLENPAFTDVFTILPGYRTQKGSLHHGNWVRREHLVTEAFTVPTVSVDGWEFGWALPEDGAPIGAWSSWEVQVRAPGPQDEGTQVELWLYLVQDDKPVHALSATLGWATWFPPEDWGTDIHRGRQVAGIDGVLEPGEYEVIAMLVVDGEPLVAPVAEDAPAPVVMAGEVRTGRTVTLSDRDAWTERTLAHVEAAKAAAAAAQCEAAEGSWALARWRSPRASAWRAEVRPAVAADIARCWARAAASGPSVAAGRRAMRWAPADPEVHQTLAPLAEARHQSGARAREGGDLDAAFQGYSDAVALEPWRVWDRRHAEEIRAERLGLEAVRSW